MIYLQSAPYKLKLYAMPTMWTSKLTLRLIENLRSLRCLWDVSSDDFRNRTKKDACIKELAEKFNVSIVEMERKIHTLKGQFRREHKKLFIEKINGNSQKKSCWFGYEPLMFLLPGFESQGYRTTDSDTEENTEEFAVDSEVSSALEESHLKSQQERALDSRPNAAKSARDEITADALNCIKALTDVVVNRDSSTIFGDFIADSIRTSGRPENEIILAKQDIMNIIINLQRGFYSSPETLSDEQSQYEFSTPQKATSSEKKISVLLPAEEK